MRWKIIKLIGLMSDQLIRLIKMLGQPVDQDKIDNDQADQAD